uniref:Uncharacterized protein n=1 Tax=Rhizophora mucronata TaxID=61149 RepID=A0A2P2QRJ3_RHIMU
MSLDVREEQFLPIGHAGNRLLFTGSTARLVRSSFPLPIPTASTRV